MITGILTFSFILLFFLLCFNLDTAFSKSLQQLQRGDSLSVEDDSDFITSPDNSFTCGFYAVGTNAYSFAIWFTNSKERTVVWMANRDKPVNGRGSKLSLWRNGALALTDTDGTIVWQTNTTSTNAAKVELLNTGNLVLKNPEREILWQSFDYPTDTLLPSQAFTKSKRLVSSLKHGDFGSGYFRLYFDSDNVLRMIYDGPQISSIYWPNPDFGVFQNGRTNYNSSRIAVLDDTGRFQSSDLLKFSAADLGSGVKRRVKIDYDGNLRLYSLINSTGLWKVSWQAMGQTCQVHGACGKSAICLYAPELKCSCPPGYEVSNQSDWSEGCKPKFDQTLLKSQQVKFVEISNTDYWGFDLNYSNLVSLEACKKLCEDDVRCVAFAYRLTGEGLCFTKGELYNGIHTPSFPGSIYFKVPARFQILESRILNTFGFTCGSGKREILVGSSSMYDLSKQSVKWAYLYSFALALGAIECVLFILGWWFLFRKHGLPEDGYSIIWSQFRRFSYAELRKATQNFNQELGKGGSGAVYKGVLEDETIVAVKRLGDILQAEEEFQAELRTIGRINHMNLVRMLGFCLEKKHRMLVYEYVENLSLDKHLFSSNFLGWEQRLQVALGTAKGLAYLHHECLEWVIHCDVKPENILLDSEFQPKIADFGISQLSQRGGIGSGVTLVRGTKGYMAPEWALNHPITAKVDVYSYGVVILEMVKGARLLNWTPDDSNEQQPNIKKLVLVVKSKIDSGDGSWIESIVDPRLHGQYNRNQASTLIKIGIDCVEDDRNKRPSMAAIVQILSECKR